MKVNMEDIRRRIIYSQEWFKDWVGKKGEKEPDFSSFRSFPYLSPLLEFYNGKKVETIEDWEERKIEIKGFLSAYFLGTFPEEVPDIINVEVINIIEAEKAVHKKIKISYDTVNMASIIIELMIPERKDSLYPVFMTQMDHRNWGLQALSRGYLVCLYPGSDQDDQTGAFKVAYPESDWALIPRRAWLASRVLDYLFTLDEVDQDKVLITGHSRNGKQSLIATAFDERISAVISSSSGSGGACSYRYMSEKYYGESVEFITRSFPEWFHPRLRFFTGREDLLPIDNHGLLGLIAPRPCLLSTAINDDCESTFAVEQSYLAGREVYKFTGAEDRINIRWRPGGHETNPYDIYSYLDWADYNFSRGDYRVADSPIYYFNWSQWRSSLPKEEGELTSERKDNYTPEERRQIIRYFLGEMPPKGKDLYKPGPGYPLEEREIARNRDLNKTVIIKSQPLYIAEGITANLYYNDNMEEANTTIIWLPPYSFAGGYDSVYQVGEQVFLYLAAKGYPVLVYDQLGFGSRILEGKDFYRHYPHWSRLGKMVSDLQSAVDLLTNEELEYGKKAFSLVDKENIYCAGYALGGLIGLYGTALDERIAGVASFSGFTPMRNREKKDNSSLKYLYETHGLIPRLGLYAGREEEIPYDYEDILSLIAPRPTLIYSPQYDSIGDLDGIERTIKKVERQWKDADDQLTFIRKEDYNRFQGEQNKILLNWLYSLRT